MLIYNTVHITDYFQFIFSMLPPDFPNQPTKFQTLFLDFQNLYGIFFHMHIFISFENALYISTFFGGQWSWHLVLCFWKQWTKLNQKNYTSKWLKIHSVFLWTLSLCITFGVRFKDCIKFIQNRSDQNIWNSLFPLLF